MLLISPDCILLENAALQTEVASSSKILVSTHQIKCCYSPQNCTLTVHVCTLSLSLWFLKIIKLNLFMSRIMPTNHYYHVDFSRKLTVGVDNMREA